MARSDKNLEALIVLCFVVLETILYSRSPKLLSEDREKIATEEEIIHHSMYDNDDDDNELSQTIARHRIVVSDCGSSYFNKQ